MPNWFGDALGSAIGLVAILLGALYNARLMRRRDDKIMNDEAKAIAVAIGAEMKVHAELLCGRMRQAFLGPDGRSEALMKALRATDPVVWPALASRVGILDPDLAEKTVRSWAMLTVHAQMLNASVEDMLAGTWSEQSMRSRCDMVSLDLPGIADAVEGLIEQRPDLMGMLPITTRTN